MRWPKGMLRLKPTGLEHRVEVRTSASAGRLVLELHRDDCYEGPLTRMPLDEAQAFLRTVQAAVDELYRQAKVAAKAERRAVQP